MFESKPLAMMSEPLVPIAEHLEPVFPQLEWDLKRAGINVETRNFIAIMLFIPFGILINGLIVAALPLILRGDVELFAILLLFFACISIIMAVYLYMIPKARISGRTTRIEKDLEYMLKDIQIQLDSGIPLFDTLVNISRGGYGECSIIADGIVQEVQSGRSMGDVLEDVGMWSPSEYLRKSLWQIVNALKSGSDVGSALAAISNDLRLDKEDKIMAYSKELNMWGLLFMMIGVVGPSMGVTLLVILSSFMGGSVINETLFWLILLALIVFHTIFISMVRYRKPVI